MIRGQHLLAAVSPRRRWGGSRQPPRQVRCHRALRRRCGHQHSGASPRETLTTPPESDSGCGSPARTFYSDATSAASPYLARSHPPTMSYSGGCQAGVPYRSGGSSPTDAPAPTHLTSSESHPGVELTYDSNSVHIPHLLTARRAHPGKSVHYSRSGAGGFGAGGREELIVGSGAMYHVTCDPADMVECEPPGYYYYSGWPHADTQG